MRLQRFFPLTLALLAACAAPQAEPGESTDTTTDVDTTPTTGDDASTGDACDGPDGCYACEPDEPARLLNHCTDAACQLFPNTTERLPLLGAGGKLPPLP